MSRTTCHLSASASAVTSQYVERVSAFSSQYGTMGTHSYAMDNLIGAPLEWPRYGDFITSASLATYGLWWRDLPCVPQKFNVPQFGVSSHDFVDVVFSEAVYPLAVHITETYEPGSVVRVSALIDAPSGGTTAQLAAGPEAGAATAAAAVWRVLWSSDRVVQQCPAASRLFSPQLHIALFRTKVLRLEFNSELLQYFAGIDSVQLVGTRRPPSIQQLLQGRPPGPITREIMRRRLHAIGYTGPLDGNVTDPATATVSSAATSSTATATATSPTSATVTSPEAIAATVASVISYSASTSSVATDAAVGRSAGEGNTTVSAHVQTECAPAAGGNSWSLLLALPEEVLLHIIGLLDLVSLRQMAAVCARLRRLCHTPALYQQLDLRMYWYLLDDRIMPFLRSLAGIVRLDLSWCGNYGAISSSSFCSVVSEVGSGLLLLRVDCCQWFDSVCLEWVGLFCRALEELSMKGCTGVESEAYWSLQYLCHLRALNLSRTQVTVAPLAACVRNTAALQHLQLSHCARLRRMSLVCAVLGQCCADLRSLVLWRINDVSWSCVHQLASCRQLQQLDLGWCRNALHDSDAPLLATVLPYWPQLLRLDLSSLRFVQDGDILQLAKSCRQLQQLVLVGADLVRTAALTTLLSECQCLRLLDISYCTHVTVFDVLRWRHLYPSCQIYHNAVQLH